MAKRGKGKKAWWNGLITWERFVVFMIVIIGVIIGLLRLPQKQPEPRLLFPQKQLEPRSLSPSIPPVPSVWRYPMNSAFHSLFATIFSTEEAARFYEPAITFFAPSDFSLVNKSPKDNRSFYQLFAQHTVVGFYPFHHLHYLATNLTAAGGYKIRSIFKNHCLAFTLKDSKVFVNGVELTHPDLFNNGPKIAFHGLAGLVPPPSPNDCMIERVTFPSPYWPRATTSSASLMRISLWHAYKVLNASRFSKAALYLLDHFITLSEHESITIFALSDSHMLLNPRYEQAYAQSFLHHVLPFYLSRKMLQNLPPETVLKKDEYTFTVELIRALVIKCDLVSNSRVVVHQVIIPLVPATTFYEVFGNLNLIKKP